MSDRLPLECVTAVAVVVSPSFWCSMVTEKHHARMISVSRQPYGT